MNMTTEDIMICGRVNTRLLGYTAPPGTDPIVQSKEDEKRFWDNIMHHKAACRDDDNKAVSRLVKLWRADQTQSHRIMGRTTTPLEQTLAKLWPRADTYPAWNALLSRLAALEILMIAERRRADLETIVLLADTAHRRATDLQLKEYRRRAMERRRSVEQAA